MERGLLAGWPPPGGAPMEHSRATVTRTGLGKREGPHAVRGRGGPTGVPVGHGGLGDPTSPGQGRGGPYYLSFCPFVHQSVCRPSQVRVGSRGWMPRGHERGSLPLHTACPKIPQKAQRAPVRRPVTAGLLAVPPAPSGHAAPSPSRRQERGASINNLLLSPRPPQGQQRSSGSVLSHASAPRPLWGFSS